MVSMLIGLAEMPIGFLRHTNPLSEDADEADFFNVGPPKESIFLTTIYGLYFSHHYTHITNYNLSHFGPLWAAFRVQY